MKPSNLNILIVLPHLTCGGTERAAAELANFIADQDGQVTLILMYNEEKFYELHPKVKVIEPDFNKKNTGKYIYVLYLIFFLRAQFKKLKPDVVFAMGYIAITLLSSLFLNTKVIMSYRSNPARVRFPKNLILNTAYLFSHWLMRSRVDGIIAQTSLALDYYNKRYSCPVVRIPNFLRELKEYKNERQNQIINVGHCAFEKGQHFLIKAFAKLNAPDWKLTIVGDGPKRKELEKLSMRLGVGAKIFFAGYQKDVDFYLSKSKIFAFTSIIEGYPNALIEAMATPLPVVSFNCEAGPIDIIRDGENGFLVDVEDIDTFAQRLQTLIDQPELRERLQHNALKIRYENDLSMIAPKYLQFFDKIAAGS